MRIDFSLLKVCSMGLLASVLMSSVVASNWESTGPERWVSTVQNSIFHNDKHITSFTAEQVTFLLNIRKQTYLCQMCSRTCSYTTRWTIWTITRSLCWLMMSLRSSRFSPTMVLSIMLQIFCLLHVVLRWLNCTNSIPTRECSIQTIRCCSVCKELIFLKLLLQLFF